MYEFDIKMPDPYKGFLLDIVKASEQERTLTGLWSTRVGLIDVHLGMKEKIIERNDIAGSPFESFECLGFVKIYRFDYATGLGTYQSGSSNNFVLLPKAFKWADYQKKGPLHKWYERNLSRFKDWILAIAFGLSVISTILEILHLIKVIP